VPEELVKQLPLLAKENVILVSRTQSDLDEVATAVNNLGVKSLTLTADDICSVDTAVAEALDKFKTIDINQ
jgi:3-oxoacyl-[acyl-carrier protein] reductase